jgi:hypothetical protein
MNENQRVHPTRLSGLAGGFRGNFLLLCGKITDWFGRFRRGKIGGAPTRLFVASGKGGGTLPHRVLTGRLRPPVFTNGYKINFFYRFMPIHCQKIQG